MIGSQFDGRGEGALHMVPQAMKLNRGKGSLWYGMESTWKQELEAGNRVAVKIEIDWPKGAKRPTGFTVNYTVTEPSGNTRQVQNFFPNQ